MRIQWRGARDLPLLGRPSALGVALGGIAFAASLTPSLIPRAGLMQGILAGICFAAAYLIGYVIMAVVHWTLETKPSPARDLLARRQLAVAVGVAVVASVWALAHVTGWQNSIHAVMGLPDVESARPFTILGVAVLVAGVLVFSGRVFRRSWRVISAQIEPFVPRRLALILSFGAAMMLFWSIGNDVIIGRALAALDATYAQIDRLIPADQPPPSDPLKSGGPGSLVNWETLGAEGRHWVAGGPHQAEIAAVTKRPAREALRVYVGLNSAPTAEERAALALAEAKRQGAFARKTLVIGTPTGTGWMDGAGMAPLEYLTGGDVAVVGVQYSYLPSWMSLILQPEYGSETAQAVFTAFHTYWHELPAETRPALYLFGLSLGARNGEITLRLPEMLGDPVAGALWAGPPFAATSWRQVIAQRNPDSPAWAPRFRDGSVIRVTSQQNHLGEAARPWGPVRTVYLAYASDPIAFFSPDVAWRQPAWLGANRGPDVTPDLHWFPLVTFLQLVFDMMTATTTPEGVGHVYAPAHYLVAWAAVLGVDTESETYAEIAKLFRP